MDAGISREKCRTAAMEASGRLGERVEEGTAAHSERAALHTHSTRVQRVKGPPLHAAASHTASLSLAMLPKPEPRPGDGLRSLDSTSIFRITNFELFVRPNKYIMAIGLASFTACFGYLYYWNHSARNDPTSATYTAVNEDDTITIRKRTSRWD